jgi:hypothetical protein
VPEGAAPRRIGPVERRVQVRERPNARGIELGESCDLATAERPAGQMDRVPFEVVEELPEILRQRLRIIRRPPFGTSVTPPGIRNHPVAVTEGGREVIKAVR